MTIVVAVASLLLTALPGTARADEHDVPAAEPTRHGPSEVQGPEASQNAMRSGRLSCGQMITQSTTLTADIGPCPGNGIIIGADNIMLNLNGHTISGAPGPGDGNAAGVRLPNRSGVLITGQPGNSRRTGTITGFDAGVVVNGGSGNTVQNLTVRDNIGPATRDAFLGDGIAVIASANNTIQGNTVDHNGIYDGIAVLGNASEGNTIRGNTVTNTVAITSFTEGTGTGVGIIVSAFLDVATGKLVEGNNIVANVVRLNDGSGISNVNTRDARVAGNTIEDNGHVAMPGNGIGQQLGQRPESTITRMVIENNAVRRNGGNGIQSILSNENQFIGNVVEDNGWDPAGAFSVAGGIAVEAPEGGHVISRNNVHHNAGIGILLHGVDGHTFGRTDNNRIEGNVVTNSEVVGILFMYRGLGINHIVSNYVVNSGLTEFGDLVDGGSAFFEVPNCGNTVWDDNTYEYATPACAGNGGTQVSVP